MLQVCTHEGRCVCIQSGAVCFLSAVDPAFIPVTGSRQISAHLQNNSPEEKFSARRPFLCLLSSSPLLPLSPTPLSLTQTEIPLSYCTQLSLSPFFFSFRSLTLSVSFYIMLSAKKPCGRAVSNKHNHTH